MWRDHCASGALLDHLQQDSCVLRGVQATDLLCDGHSVLGNLLGAWGNDAARDVLCHGLCLLQHLLRGFLRHTRGALPTVKDTQTADHFGSPRSSMLPISCRKRPVASTWPGPGSQLQACPRLRSKRLRRAHLNTGLGGVVAVLVCDAGHLLAARAHDATGRLLGDGNCLAGHLQ